MCGTGWRVDAEAQAFAAKVCASGDPSVAREEGGDIFSIGSAPLHDR